MEAKIKSKKTQIIDSIKSDVKSVHYHITETRYLTV